MTTDNNWWADWEKQEQERQKQGQQKWMQDQQKASFLKSYLENIPQGVYAAWLKRQQQPFQNYYQNMYGDFYSEYQGELAKQAQGGTEPALDFGSFLNTLDLNKRYAGQTAYQKGFRNYNAAPRTRFLSY